MNKKEELLQKLKEAYGNKSQEERVKLLEEINNILRDANKELRGVYLDAKKEIEEEKLRKVREEI